MLDPILNKDDRKAHISIWVFSILLIIAITLLDKFISVDASLPFDPHLFAKMNAGINSIVTILLLAGLYLVKKRNYKAHKNVMLTAMGFSILFLVFYIVHHLFTGETKFGDLNLDGELSLAEKEAAGSIRYVYYFIIASHITLSGLVLPFVLYTAYRAAISEFSLHAKLARWTYPIWLYVAITGVIVYFMISPFYQ